MKKSWTCLLVLIILSSFLVILSISFVCANIRINEIELNPNDDCGDCTEWLELYSDTETNLTGWELKDADDHILELGFTINGYYILENISVSLNNNNEQLFLYDDSDDLIDETDLLSDNDNDDKTLQYCNGNWNFIDSTKGFENSCKDKEEDNEKESEISISIDWDKEEITNRKEFKIEIIAENLDESKNYDVKVWIEFENNNTKISQTYDENNKWVSSNQYYNNFFEGETEETKNIKLRIYENYNNYGDAIIYLRIRQTGSSNYIKEINKAIKILEPKENKTNGTEKIIVTNLPNTKQVIKLGNLDSSKTEDIKTQKNIIYQSKTEEVKKYAVFGFALLCVGLSVLLIFNKLE